MIVRLIATGLLGLAASGSSHAEGTVPLAPFQAEYRVLRNGDAIGHATLQLRELDGDDWEFSNRTRGTSGLAGLLGVDVTEASTFHWSDGRPEGLDYHYMQHAAIKSRKRSIRFDWRDERASTREGRKHWNTALVPGAMDRSLVTVALMADLHSASATALDYPVVEKDRIETQHYVRGANETLDLPAGRIDAVRVERERRHGSRQTICWFAPAMAWLPVQIEQIEKHGETITMQLESAPR